MRRVVIAFLLASGCATPPPAEHLNQRAVLYELRAKDDIVEKRGLSAEQAVAFALVNNPKLRLARAERRIASAKIASAGALKNPQLRVALKDVLGGNPLALSAAVRIYPPRPDEQKAAIDRAKAEERKVISEVEVLEQEVAADTLTAHARLWMLGEKQKLLSAALEIHERVVVMEEQRMAEHQSTRIDVALAAMKRDRLEDRVEDVELKREAAATKLARLMGVPSFGGVASPIPARSSTSTWSLGAFDQAELEEIALRERPDLQVLDASLDVREARLRLERAEDSLWPRFVQPGIDVDRVEIGSAMDLPLFEEENGAANAELRAQRAKSRIVTRLQMLRSEIRRSLDRLRRAERRRKRFEEKTSPRLQEVEAVIALGLQASEVDALKLQNMSSRVLQARASGLDAVYDERRAQIRLALAVGTVLTLPP